MSSMDKECESGVFNYYCSVLNITTIINYLETYAIYKNYSLGKNVQVVIGNIDKNSFISLKSDHKNKIFNGGLDITRGCVCYKLLHDFIDYNEEDYKDKEQYLAFYDKFNINIYNDSTNYENYSSICVYVYIYSYGINAYKDISSSIFKSQSTNKQ